MNLVMKFLLKLRSEEKPVKFILSRFLWISGLCRFFYIKCKGYILRFYPTALSCGLWVDSNIRKEDEDFIRDYLKNGDIIIDVGANIGALAILSSVLVGKKGKVFAFEPHPQIFNYMNQNISLNNLTNIKAFNVALGNETGKLYFENNKLDDMNRVTTIKHNKHILVEIEKLDNLLDGTQKIALFKVDVEGFEKFVLEGAQEILNNTICLYFESSEDHFQKFGYSTKDLLIFIKSYGFKIYTLKGKMLSLIKSDHVSLVGENLIAIKNLDNFIERSHYKVETQLLY